MTSQPHRRSRKSIDVFVLCECERAGGRSHGIAPGCPGMDDEALRFIPGDAPGTIRFINKSPVKTSTNIPVGYYPPPRDESETVSTSSLVDSFLKHKMNRGVKESTLRTYEKKLGPFERYFPILPEDLSPVMEFLANFTGKSGRHRKNYQATLRALYQHAVQFHNFPKNVLQNVDPPIVRKKAIKTLELEQVLRLLEIADNLKEQAALSLLIGQGWRQVEVRRVLARDVREIEAGQIWCRGKMVEEWAPILPETLLLLEELADGLPDENHIFVGNRLGRPEPLGATGLSRLVDRLFASADLHGYTGHDLRRTFATLVTDASGDELLGMRLVRDKVPGMSDRYVKRDLVALLPLWSPLRQVDDLPSQKTVSPQPAKAGETQNSQWWRRGRVELPVQKRP